MKVSIIIPTCKAKNLVPCSESVRKFTDLTDTEIIVVANGYDYGDEKGFPGYQVRLLWFDQMIGYPAAINAGIKAAKGEYLVLLNDDTILLEQPKNQWIDILLRAFWDDKAAISGPMKEWCPWAQYHFILFFCAMIRKSALDSVGLLDEAFAPGIGEDTDLCCRMQLAGFKIVQVPDDNDYRFYDHNKRLGNFPIFHRGTQTFQHLGDEISPTVQGI